MLTLGAALLLGLAASGHCLVMCGGITALCKPELEQDVRQFFETRKIDLGGKTLAQYLEQLRIAVSFGERDRHRLREYVQGR